MILSKNPPAASHMGGVCEQQILLLILKNYGASLDNESLQTLVTEVEAEVEVEVGNSRPLTIERLSDPTSLMPLSPANLLTSKKKVIMPPHGNFDQPDIYSRCRWRRIQHLANEFWSRWKNKFLSTLQGRQKWNDLKENSEVEDIVLLKMNNMDQNEWPMVQVVEKMPDKDGLVRSVKLPIGSKNNSDQTLIRPIKKLVLLVRNKDVQFPNEDIELYLGVKTRPSNLRGAR